MIAIGPPVFLIVRAGITDLSSLSCQRLNDRKLATVHTEEQDDPASDDIPAEKITALAAVSAA